MDWSHSIEAELSTGEREPVVKKMMGESFFDYFFEDDELFDEEEEYEVEQERNRDHARDNDW